MRIPGGGNEFKSCLVENGFNSRVLSFTKSAKQIEITWIVRSADNVLNSIVVEVHKLWAGCDASVNRCLRVNPTSLQFADGRVQGTRVIAFIPEVPKITRKITHQKIAISITVHVRNAGTGVCDAG